MGIYAWLVFTEPTLAGVHRIGCCLPSFGRTAPPKRLYDYSDWPKYGQRSSSRPLQSYTTPLAVFLSPAANRRSYVSYYCGHYGDPDAHDEWTFYSAFRFGSVDRNADRHAVGGLVSDASGYGRVPSALL